MLICRGENLIIIMFPSSSQAKYWMFINEEAIQTIKTETNKNFISR